MTDNNGMQLQANAAEISSIRMAFATEMERRGLGYLCDRIPTDLSSSTTQADPYDGSLTFSGEWRTESGQRLGSVVIHQGGQVFAEFDLLVPHPRDSRWFVESVTSWGTINDLKAELRLLPALADD